MRAEQDRKGTLLACAIVGAVGLVLGWAAWELSGKGGRARERPSEEKNVVITAADQAVREEDKRGRTATQIEEDEIVEALDEGSEHTARDKERGTSKSRG